MQSARTRELKNLRAPARLPFLRMFRTVIFKSTASGDIFNEYDGRSACRRLSAIHPNGSTTIQFCTSVNCLLGRVPEDRRSDAVAVRLLRKACPHAGRVSRAVSADLPARGDAAGVVSERVRVPERNVCRVLERAAAVGAGGATELILRTEQARDAAVRKVAEYQADPALRLFVKSDDVQAREIVRLTTRPVFSVARNGLV